MQKFINTFKALPLEKIYLLLAFPLGIGMLLFNPPFAGVPDEHAHFWKVASIANGHWTCSGEDTIPQSAHTLPDDIKPQKIDGLDDKKMIIANMKKELVEPLNNAPTTIGGAVCSASFIGYLPQVIGWKIGESIELSGLASFYLARLGNFLVAIFLIYTAIRIIPFGKIILVLIALLPMTVQQLASVSYDGLHIALVFLFTAMLLRYAITDTVISKKALIAIIIISLLITSIKPYIFLLLLLFIIPPKKFASRLKYFMCGVGAFVINIVSLYVTRNIFQDQGGYKDGIDPGSQLIYIFTHPIQFSYAIIDTFYSKIIFFTETFLYKPGWLNHDLPSVFYLILIIGIVIILKNSQEKYTIELWQRRILLLVFFLNFALIFVSLYAVWTKVGNNTIIGVQGRYFLSIAPILILALYKFDFSLQYRWVQKHIYLITPIFLLSIFAFVFWSIFSIYYDKSNAGKERNYITVRQADTETVRSLPFISVDGELKQLFVSEYDYFSGTKIYLEKGTLEKITTFELRDETCTEIIDSKKIEPTQENITSLEIKFGAKAQTKGKTFCLYSKDFQDNKRSIRFSETLYQKGSLEINDGKKSGNIVFDLLYKNIN